MVRNRRYGFLCSGVGILCRHFTPELKDTDKGNYKYPLPKHPLKTPTLYVRLSK